MEFSPPHASKNRSDHLFTPATASGDDFDAGQRRKMAVEESSDLLLCLAVPAGWLICLVAFLAEHVASAILGFVFPIAVLIGESRAAPAMFASLIRRAAFGLFAAACTFAVLVAAFVVSVLLGFVLVRHCVVEPVTVRQPLYFDYTEAHPSAAVTLGKARGTALPASQSVSVSLALLLPDSDHNREIGVFQVKAEAISYSGVTLASSTQPYMLRYKSPTVRLVQAALMCVPLTIGIRSESQTAILEVLHYREGRDRRKKTEHIKVLLQPRAMTTHLPQVYKCEIVVQTALPWAKELVHSWKWTLCIWVSFSVYVVLLVLVIYWVRTLQLSSRGRSISERQVCRKTSSKLSRKDLGESSKRGFSGGGAMKWRERRSKNMAQLLIRHEGSVEHKFTRGSAFSPVGMETGEVIDDPVEFSESSVSEVN